MRTLQFDTQEQAIQRNQAEAVSRGCNGNVTSSWWSMYEQGGKWYLDVGDDAILEGEVTINIERRIDDGA